MRQGSSLALLAVIVWTNLIGTAAAQPIAPGYVPPPIAPQQPAAPLVPFVLTPQEQAAVDGLLRAWEQKSGQITTFACEFTLLKYDGTWELQGKALEEARKKNPNAHANNTPRHQLRGEIKFAKPDRGLYRVASDEEPNRGEEQEYWVCDGKALYTKEYSKKQVVEHRLPPEMQGKSIVDSPMPFVFGVEAQKMQERYWIRIITPPGNAGQVWIEAFPKRASDAANYRRVQVILEAQELTPMAMQVFHLNDQSPKIKVSDVYTFSSIKKNGMLDRFGDFLNLFVGPPTPFGWRRIVEDPAAAVEAPQYRPVGVVAPPGAPGQIDAGISGQVNRPVTLPPKR